MYAAIGTVAWVVVFFTHGEPIQRMVALGPLAVVPWMLCHLPVRGRGRESRVLRSLIVVAPAGSVGVLVSLFVPEGPIAGLLAVPWMIAAVTGAIFAAERTAARGLRPWSEGGADAALAFWVVGGVWLLAARFGSPLLRFHEPWVSLTAVHFHVAGVGGAFVAARIGRLVPAPITPRLFQANELATVGVIVGMPLVAAGIVGGGVLQLVGAVILAISFGLVAANGIMFGAMRRDLPRLGRGLVVVACLCVLGGMALAVFYAYGASLDRSAISITAMVKWHGLLNGVGFALCGTIGLALVSAPAQVRPAIPPLSRIRGTARIGADFLRRIGALEERSIPPTGTVSSLDAYFRQDFDPDAVHPSVRLFYEETRRWEIRVKARWHLPIRRVWNRFSRSIEQIGLPTGKGVEETTSEIVAVSSETDGREQARAWIRVGGTSGVAMFVAVYADHRRDGVGYMSVSLPMPGGALSAVLLPELLDGGGMRLRSDARARLGGDQGVYWSWGGRSVRAPINEELRIWSDDPAVPEHAERRTIRAIHRIRVVGLPLVTLEYDAALRGAESDPAET